MYHSETAAVDATAACTQFAPLRGARRETPDATLIARSATGDRRAMHALFARHKTRVYRFILRLVGDAASADDLASEAFSRFGGMRTSFGGTRLRRLGYLRLRASRRSRNCGAGATRRSTPKKRTRATLLPTRKHPGRTSIAERSCASACTRSRPSTARLSTSFITTTSPCKRSRRSSGFHAPP
jgi:DNA-directed RNA polymerase specialized sigma24 family protein